MLAGAGFIGRGILRMPAGRPKAVTPGSVKVLMLIEAAVIFYLSFWVASEYTFNVYFQTYVNTVFLEHITTYTALIGLCIGLGGSFATFALYRNMKQAKLRMETVTSPRIKGIMDRVFENLSSIDESPVVQLVKHVPSEVTGTSALEGTARPSQLLEQKE